ncbi:hypothetical protein [Paenibacillus gansuensis]|uniref:RDD domain-containing protein n=1 Tax=Paenibacillus gansuensis TaxID=306542 RepID=A0ABW5PH63_9BACL
MDKWLKDIESSKYGRKVISPENKNTTVSEHVVYHVIQEQVKYVGFWRRLFAFLIDSTLVGALLTILNTSIIWEIIIWFFYQSYWPSTYLQGTIGKLAIGAVITDNKGAKLFLYF